MTRMTTALAVVLAASLSACGDDVTASDEYLELEQEAADLEREVAALEQQLADLAEASADAAAREVPTDVVALLDAWWAANERGDGSVVDLYLPAGHHLYGEERIGRDELPGHFGSGDYTPEWITEPYLVAAEPEGRYVVTRGMRSTFAGGSVASALSFEIITDLDGNLGIVQSAWLFAH